MISGNPSGGTITVGRISFGVGQESKVSITTNAADSLADVVSRLDQAINASNARMVSEIKQGTTDTLDIGGIIEGKSFFLDISEKSFLLIRDL